MAALALMPTPAPPRPPSPAINAGPLVPKPLAPRWAPRRDWVSKSGTHEEVEQRDAEPTQGGRSFNGASESRRNEEAGSTGQGCTASTSGTGANGSRRTATSAAGGASGGNGSDSDDDEERPRRPGRAAPPPPSDSQPPRQRQRNDKGKSKEANGSSSRRTSTSSSAPASSSSTSTPSSYTAPLRGSLYRMRARLEAEHARKQNLLESRIRPQAARLEAERQRVDGEVLEMERQRRDVVLRESGVLEGRGSGSSGAANASESRSGRGGSVGGRASSSLNRGGRGQPPSSSRRA